MKKLFLAFLFVLLFPASSLAAFPDVSSTHPYYEAINYVQSEHIVKGYDDGLFRPDQLINRAEFTKIITKSLVTRQNPGTCLPLINLTDLRITDWFYPYVCVAINDGIIHGYPDSTFQAANFINYAEAAKILVQAYDITNSAGSGPWFIQFTNEIERANAKPASVNSPDQHITRGEMAEMIYRLRNVKATYTLTPAEQQAATKCKELDGHPHLVFSELYGEEQLFCSFLFAGECTQNELINNECTRQLQPTPANYTCIQDPPKELVTSIPHTKYTLSYLELEDFKRIAGIYIFCIPEKLGPLFLNVDWDVNSADPSYQADFGRMISLGFKNLYGNNGGWGNGLIVYSTYDFGIGSEYDIYATPADYQAIQNGTKENTITADEVTGFVQYRWHPWFESIEKSIVFPFQNHYIAIVYRLSGDYKNNYNDIIKDLYAHKYPPEDTENLQMIDSFVQSLFFSINQ